MIEFLYLLQKIFKKRSKGKYYGGFAEDVFLKNYFRTKKKGFYVDVGCYHPIADSLTYSLYKKGWTGMNIDGSKKSIKMFDIVRSKDINVHAAISNINGIRYYYKKSEINQRNSLIKNNKLNKIKVKVFTLNNLLKQYNIKNIDFLNIDTEGNDLNVIKSLDLKKYHPQIICIEENKKSIVSILNNGIFKFLKKNNFFLFSRHGVTSIYVNNKYKKNILKIINH